MHKFEQKFDLEHEQFYLLFCFGPQVCIGNSSFRIWGVLPWCGSVRNIIHTHTHTHIILPQHFTYNFSHHSLFTCDTFTNRERPAFFEWCSSVPTCVIIFSMFFVMGNRESLHDISLLRQGKSNENRDISAVVLKLFNFYCQNKWCPCFFTLAVPNQFTCPVWGQEPAFLRTDIADCWLRDKYSVRLIITQLEQAVTQWTAILFQLVCGSTIYRQSLSLYIKLRWNYNPQWSLPMGHLNFSTSSVKSMTWQCSH
jgi:hypothetical protein